MLDIRRGLTAIRLIVLPLIALLSTACSGRALTLGGTEMAKANELYEVSAFAEAASRYQALVDAGVDDGRVYYNLGGAYYKLGDLGRAILNFRRAQRLLPRDEDVVANLKLARAQTVDRIRIEDEGAIVNLMRRIVGWSTVNELSLAAVYLWIGLAGLGIVAIVWREKRRLLGFIGTGIAVCIVILLFSVGIRLLDERRQPPGVVVAEEVAVRSGPGEDYLTEFDLHSGTEVRVVDLRAGWTRIILPGDLQGWAPSDAIIQLWDGN